MMDAGYQAEKGLENLKNAFLLYLIGFVLALVPVIGAVAGILYIVALIFLILGWRALGRSSLSQRVNYGSTGRWFIYAIIIAIVIGIIGGVISAIVLFSAIASQQLFNSTSAIGNPPHLPPSVVEPFLAGIMGTVIVVYIVWISAWVRMRGSTSHLAVEVSQPRIATAGLLYLVQVLVAFISAAGLFYSLSTGIFSFTNLSQIGGTGALFGSYYGMLAGDFAIFSVLGLLSSAIGIAASYLGYEGVKNALSSNVVATRFRTPPPPPPPPPGVGSPSATQRGTPAYCPRCGHGIDIPDSSFCPSCGVSLRAA